MAELVWPSDLVPYKVGFYLQPHVGGSESPFTRVRKTYALSAPRWLARLTFRGGYDGEARFGEQSGYGPRLDAMIADLEGGVHLTRFHDWRRPRPVGKMALRTTPTSEGAAIGATSMVIGGFAPNSRVLQLGDYVGGDGRPHIVSYAATAAAGGIVSGAGSVMAGADGRAVVGFRPPLSAEVLSGTAMIWPVTGLFQLVGEDAGQNEVAVGEAMEMTLDFVEFLRVSGLRNLPAGLATEVEAQELRPFMGLHIDLPDPVFAVTGNASIRYEGEDWTAIGGIGSIDTIGEGTDGSATGVRATLYQVLAEFRDDVADQAQRGCLYELYVGALDPGYREVVGFKKIWVGRLDSYDITDAGQSITVSAGGESRQRDQRRPAIKRFTDWWQQRKHPGDRFFEYVSRMTEVPILWAKARQDV